MASTLFAEPQASLSFPQSLTEKYKPQRLADFVGLEKPRKVLAKLAANPRPMALLFVGNPGTGKTSMAFAFARELNAETWHIGSQDCSVDRLRELCRMCQYVPFGGGYRIIICDEFDAASDAAIKFLLSRLDGSEQIGQTIFIFTANDVSRLEERFLSRCLKLDFNSYGSGSEIADLLTRVWNAETNGAPAPNFKRIAEGNVRQSLQKLELEILAL